jgi:hypothetical protein
MRGIKLTIVLKRKFPVGAMDPLPAPCGRAWFPGLFDLFFFSSMTVTRRLV